MSTSPCPCGGACNCHGSSGAFPTPCNIPGGCGSERRVDELLDQAPELGNTEGLCVLGCADRSRSDIWPRPPRPRVDGQLTCRPCTDRILVVLTEVLELAVSLQLVTAAGSAPSDPHAGGGRKLIKDEPVAPVPVSVPAAALTDIRSRRGTWVPDADPAPAPAGSEQDVAAGDDDRPTLVDLADQAAAASKKLNTATGVFGARSTQARAAAADLHHSRARLAAAQRPRRAQPRSVDPRDNDPASVVGFLDRWTDRVRIGRNLLGAGTCPAYMHEPQRIRTGPFGGWQDWPRTVVCSRPTEYRRLVRIEMGAHTTGLFAVCGAGHVTRPDDQGDQQLAQRAGHGHRPTRGVRHGLTIFAAINLLDTHNDWVCSQDWVRDYWRGLRELRADLGRAHGEPQPARIGFCPNGTGDVDESTGQEILCGQPLYASPYSDNIECSRCGRTWTHRQWGLLGRMIGVIA